MRTVEKKMQESCTLLTIPPTHVPFRIIPGVELADGASLLDEHSGSCHEKSRLRARTRNRLRLHPDYPAS
jgi:hypothetical protein